MNERQKQIVTLFLMEPERQFLVQEIADRLQCSEKTVRNDFKDIDSWLEKNSTATLIRKRSKGVYLEFDEDEKKKLVHLLHITDSPSENTMLDEERQYEILKLILNKNKQFTNQELAKRFFTNKEVIKKDLAVLEEFLSSFEIEITTKQKLGIVVVGNELKRRSALVKFLEKTRRTPLTSLFNEHELAVVKKELGALEKELPLPFTEESFQNVVIHILIAVSRIKQKNTMQITTDELATLKEKRAYSLAKKLTGNIESSFSLKFPEHEVAYIALRLLGAKTQYASYMEDKNEVSADIEAPVKEYIQTLVQEISTLTKVKFSEDKQLYRDLSIHLQSTFHRIKYHLPISNPMTKDIKKMYPYMFQVIYSTVPLEPPLPEEEIAYLTLHFQSALERIQKLQGENKRAIIVCSMGIGMSQLLKTKVERRFHGLEIVDCLPASQLKGKGNYDGVDFIISTMPLETDIPSIEISPLFFDYEQKKIEDFIKGMNSSEEYPVIKSLLHKDLIFLHLSGENRYDVVEQVTSFLYESGFVEKEYIHSAMKRERSSPTLIGGGIAIPHGSPAFVKKPVIAVVTLEEPMAWGDETASVIFLLANNMEDSSMTKDLFHELSNMSENVGIVNKLAKQTTVQGFLDML